MTFWLHLYYTLFTIYSNRTHVKIERIWYGIGLRLEILEKFW